MNTTPEKPPPRAATPQYPGTSTGFRRNPPPGGKKPLVIVHTTPSLGGDSPTGLDASVTLCFSDDLTTSGGGALKGFWSDCVSHQTANELMTRAAAGGRIDFYDIDPLNLVVGWLIEQRHLT